MIGPVYVHNVRLEILKVENGRTTYRVVSLYGVDKGNNHVYRYEGSQERYPYVMKGEICTS